MNGFLDSLLAPPAGEPGQTLTQHLLNQKEAA